MPSGTGAKAPPALEFWRRRLRSFRAVVLDSSMVPTLLPGDHLFVDRSAYRSAEPQPGEIVVLRDPEQVGRRLIKRVAAVGPGRFEWQDSEVRPVSSVPENASAGDRMERASFDLREDSLVVLSEARTHGRDSRRFGPILRSCLLGRVWFRYAPFERRGRI